MARIIYLDNNASTPVDPAVLEAMLPYLTRQFGNPSNPSHEYGVGMADAVEHARCQVAALIGASAREIVFTSGATESDNLAVLGVCRRQRAKGDHVITAVAEHKAVLEPCHQLEREGYHVTYLPVDKYGQVNPGDVAAAVRPRTVLVTIMAANNEVGTLQPIAEIGRICSERGVVFHSDAVQMLGKLPVDVEEMGIDLLSMSAHKMYGPQGIGAFFIRENGPAMHLEPVCYGGGQERGLRPGTLPVANIVGLGAACEIALQKLQTEAALLRVLRGRLREQLEAAVPGLVFHGHSSEHLPGLLSVGFPDVEGDVLIQLLENVAVSQGSACSAGSFATSHVLRAMGVSDELARATLRFGVGRFNTLDEIDQAATRVEEAFERSQVAEKGT